jgi:molybdopterin-guanine dinucleotide biosynthesis protein B
MLSTASIPVLGFAAFSGAGKTTLLIRLLPLLRARGVRIGMIKHAHHRFDIDHPGKDSYELRRAGAAQMLIASRRRWALMNENDPPEEPQLAQLVERLDQNRLDIILVEGFKHERFDKIELYRTELDHPLLFPDDDTVVAVAADGPLPCPTQLPQLDLNEPTEIADFVTSHCLGPGRPTAGR